MLTRWTATLKYLEFVYITPSSVITLPPTISFLVSEDLANSPFYLLVKKGVFYRVGLHIW